MSKDWETSKIISNQFYYNNIACAADKLKQMTPENIFFRIKTSSSMVRESRCYLKSFLGIYYIEIVINVTM